MDGQCNDQCYHQLLVVQDDTNAHTCAQSMSCVNDALTGTRSLHTYNIPALHTLHAQRHGGYSSLIVASHFPTLSLTYDDAVKDAPQLHAVGCHLLPHDSQSTTSAANLAMHMLALLRLNARN